MTYFECVTILDDMINLPINNQKLNQLENADISLNNDRYYRFLSQVHYLLKERFRLLEDKLTTRFYDKIHTPEELTLELNVLNEEFNYCKKIIKMKHLKKEDYSEFLKKLIQMNNDLVNILSNMFEDETYKTLIEGYIVKENDNNEL